MARPVALFAVSAVLALAALPATARAQPADRLAHHQRVPAVPGGAAEGP
jgi:hypothetical protein